MKRDMDLIRAILQQVEAHDHGQAPQRIVVDGYTREQVGYHEYLIADAGLAVGINGTCLDDESPNWSLCYLTNAGHDFVDATRDAGVWQKARTVIGKARGATLQIWTRVCSSIVSHNIESAIDGWTDSIG